MIELVGTSHISPESIAAASQKIEELDPDIIAVELDQRRYQTLLQGGKQQYSIQQPLISLIQYIQHTLSKKTGITPGQELMTAVEEAQRHDLPVAFIDQDIRRTVDRLSSIPLTEKIKLAGYLLLSPLYPLDDMEGFDLEEVPSQDLIERLLIRIRVSFPHLHQVLIEERNTIMARRLQELENEFGTVLAFVGAGHVSGIETLLKDNTY